MKVVKEAIYTSIFGSTTFHNPEITPFYEIEGINSVDRLSTQST
ncbi:hypothetical protein [Flavobacterium suzhouense]|uniref:Uncharacterized protein n=1 Tax=Flavobacterium suzhouense TaxID=1529638 RepID=A0ABW5NYB0_9FLAO